MSKTSIQEGNQIIIDYLSNYSNTIDITMFAETKQGAIYKDAPENFGFHINWNSIMYVVNQLENHGYYVYINSNSCMISKKNFFILCGEKDKIYNLFHCVVKAIKNFENNV